MTSTSCEELASRVLADCIAGNAPPRLPGELLQPECAGALFGILVEGLADRFEPALASVYAQLFAPVFPGADLERYRRIRVPRLVAGEPRRVYFLSRVTLGADIAVTSVLMDAARRRFPAAEIIFAGPRKNYQLFEADRRIAHAEIDYRRGTLAERLASAREVAALVDGVVIDPDSRLTQLGLVPAGDESSYHLFESRSYGGDTTDALPQLAARWAAETFGVEGARPYLAVRPHEFDLPRDYIAVSLGVGGNLEKSLPDPFESELLQLLAARGPLVIDRGAGGEEAERVMRAAPQARFWDGSFAGFAHIISRARLYVGYDSAGQHAAAAANVPLITVFAGFPTSRMFERWRPVSAGAAVIRCDTRDPAAALAAVAAALDKI